MLFVLLGLGVVSYGLYDLTQKALQYPKTIAVSAEVMRTSATTTQFVLSASPITPVWLYIPSIGVHAQVEEVGNTSGDAMAAPKKFSDVGWYRLGAKPGEAGNAVFAGHVNNALTKAGVFEHLGNVAVGEKIIAEGKEATLTFEIVRIEDYTQDDAPLPLIFAKEGPSGVVLITCAGEWDAHARAYDKRLVVFARLVQ